MIYSEEFKKQAVLKFINRGNRSVASIAAELNTSDKNLYRWHDELSGATSMKKNKNLKKATKSVTAEEKFNHLIKTSHLNEHDLGEYLRKHGILSTELKEWKAGILIGMNSVGRPKKDPELFELRKDKQKLEKDLRRKEKAMAEMSARIFLLKKSHEIFGDNEDEE